MITIFAGETNQEPVQIAQKENLNSATARALNGLWIHPTASADLKKSMEAMSKANYAIFIYSPSYQKCHVLPRRAYASDVCIVRVVHQPGERRASDTHHRHFQAPNRKGNIHKKSSFNIHSGGFLCPFPWLKDHPGTIRGPSKLSTWHQIRQKFWTNVAVDSGMRCKIGVNTSKIRIKMDDSF